MIRDVKFRGYDTKENRWSYGDLIKSINYETSKPIKKTIEYQIHETIITKDGALKYQRVNFNIDDYSIGEYTGVKDCNDVEIYEGDIVKLCVDDEQSKYKDLNGKTGYIYFTHGSFFVNTDDYIVSLYEINLEANYIEITDNLYEYLERKRNETEKIR